MIPTPANLVNMIAADVCSPVVPSPNHAKVPHLATVLASDTCVIREMFLQQMLLERLPLRRVKLLEPILLHR